MCCLKKVMHSLISINRTKRTSGQSSTTERTGNTMQVKTFFILNSLKCNK